MKLVVISDTHSLHEHIVGGIPDGDVLIHGGDFVGRNSRDSVSTFLQWFIAQPHPHKIFIAGNHDGPFESDPDWARQQIEGIPNVHYLQDSEVVIEGIRFWGTPWQPEFFNWHFQLSEQGLKSKWNLIPNGIDVLISHGPPYGILDMCPNIYPPYEDVHVGSPSLREAVRHRKPRIHIFGHIHEGYGTHEEEGTLFMNASCLNRVNRPRNPALQVNLFG